MKLTMIEILSNLQGGQDKGGTGQRRIRYNYTAITNGRLSFSINFKLAKIMI